VREKKSGEAGRSASGGGHKFAGVGTDDIVSNAPRMGIGGGWWVVVEMTAVGEAELASLLVIPSLEIMRENCVIRRMP
jgi:hypothetical protein